MPVKEMAERLGTSVANIKRAFFGTGESIWCFRRYANQPALVRQVLAFYEKHGRTKTEERFPEISVRSVVERYPNFSPRQIRWTEEQIIEAAKMAGLVSYKAQAKYFNRPNAFEGSICALWMKRFGIGQGQINGLVRSQVRPLIQGGHSKYISRVGQSRKGKRGQFQSLILWVDLEKMLKDDVPEFMKEAVRTLASFQRWLWRSDDPKPLILNMIKERELPVGRVRKCHVD